MIVIMENFSNLMKIIPIYYIQKTIIPAIDRYILRPSSLSELAPMISNMRLTHLGSDLSNNIIILYKEQKSTNILVLNKIN